MDFSCIFVVLLIIKTEIMKTITSLFILVLLFVVNSLTAQTKTITATVINATSNKGKISFALYNKTTFLKQPIKALTAKIENGKSTITYEEIENGEYAIVCYHDKNNNDKMDFAPNGMPIEDYGASNNIMAMGPPMFDDAKFVVGDKDVSLEIKF